MEVVSEAMQVFDFALDGPLAALRTPRLYAVCQESPAYLLLILFLVSSFVPFYLLRGHALCSRCIQLLCRPRMSTPSSSALPLTWPGTAPLSRWLLTTKFPGDTRQCSIPTHTPTHTKKRKRKGKGKERKGNSRDFAPFVSLPHLHLSRSVY